MRVVGVLGFSFKAILIKLAYATYPVDAVTLLALRMLYSAPFFVAMAWWAARVRGPAAHARRLEAASRCWASSATTSRASSTSWASSTSPPALERLVLFLYPTMVVLLSALWLREPITRRIGLALVVSYAGIALVFVSDLRVGGDPRAVLTGGALVFASAFLYAIYLVRAGPIIARIGSMRFISWAMLARRYSCWRSSRRRATFARSPCRRRSMASRWRWPCSRPCCRPG